MLRWLATLALLGACTDTDAPAPLAGALQLSDLSILLPLARNQADLDVALAPGAPARGGALLPESTYTPGDIAGYDSLRAVAIRLDPCFGHLGPITDPAGCHAQLRVVFQPMLVDVDGNAFAMDDGVHAFYALTADELRDAVADIVAARVEAAGGADDDLGPLAPHPYAVRDGLGGAFAQRLFAIVATYAGAANLERFTTLEVQVPFVADGGGIDTPIFSGAWRLASFTVADAAATPRAIPSLPDEPTVMTFGTETSPLETSFSPATTSADSLATLANFGVAQAAAPADQQAAFAAALRVENPLRNSPDTIDCATCHMAEPARLLVGAPLGLALANQPDGFVADPAIPAADLAATTQPLDAPTGLLNIHAFSYRDTQPMINQRVINETAANLAYLRTRY